MALSRGTQKVERMTITLVPIGDERSYRNVPSTFSTEKRTYKWRQMQELNYMLVPRKISSNEIKIDIYLNSPKRKKTSGNTVMKLVQEFVMEKVQSEWRGLKFSGIAKAASALPPAETVTRGTIEEILGATLEK